MDPANTTRPAPLARLSVPAKHRPRPYRRSSARLRGSHVVRGAQSTKANPFSLRDAQSSRSSSSESIARRAILREHRQRVHCAMCNSAGTPAATPLRNAQSSKSTSIDSIAHRAIQKEHPQRVHCATHYPAGALAGSESIVRRAIRKTVAFSGLCAA